MEKDNSKKGIIIGLIVLVAAIVGITALTQADPEPIQQRQVVDDVAETENLELVDGVYAINPDTAVIGWEASKRAGVGPHNGVVAVESGFITVANNNIVDGQVVVNMTSIETIDGGEGNEQLDGHLNSADFFDTNLYSTATIDLVSASPALGNNIDLIADLTIRDTTDQIMVPAEVSTDDGVIQVQTELEVDRDTFGVATDSALANIGLADSFTLQVALVGELEN
jgi:polyisoprenoid-binding protein YceI